MATAVLTPMQTGAPKTLGSTMFRKQILPLGSINYKGRKVTFDKKYLTDLAKSFEAAAFDQVPFLLADAENKHTMDPERFRGEIKGVEMASDGLYATMDLTPDAASLVRKNPKLGVSARIIEGLEHADGRQFGRALQHVLGTLDPRVTGMKSWEEVSLANELEVDDTIDLTEEQYDKEETVAPTPQNAPSGSGSAETSTDVQLSAEDRAFIDAAVAAATSAGADEGQIDLVRGQLEESRKEIRELKLTNARNSWASTRKDLLHAGVPKAMLDLAAPVMESCDAVTLELSRDGKDEELDVRAILLSVLTAAKGTIDLNREDGHEDDDAQELQDKQEDALLESWTV